MASFRYRPIMHLLRSTVLSYIWTSHALTVWSRILLEKISQLDRLVIFKSSLCREPKSSCRVFQSPPLLCLFWATEIQSALSRPVSLRSLLMSFTLVGLHLPNADIRQVFPRITLSVYFLSVLHQPILTQFYWFGRPNSVPVIDKQTSNYAAIIA